MRLRDEIRNVDAMSGLAKIRFYDGWNLIEERITYTNDTTPTIRYYWGKDLSGTFQGAGGVGGLLYLTVSTSNIEPQTPNSPTPNSQLFVPCYDNNGNVTRYLDANGSPVAQYTYDAFGNTIGKSGPMCDFFRHRFSTKYIDAETGLYYYGYRFYCPWLMRWINRDPIAEGGGVNLYDFCSNRPLSVFDSLGLTSVKINVKTEERDSGKGYLNFIGIEVTVIEPPKGNRKLNFIQLKKPKLEDWSLDIQGTPGPYYYRLFDTKKFSHKNKARQDVLTLYDAPGGFSDRVEFYSAVVEVSRSCKYDNTVFKLFKCYDSVWLIASVSWAYAPDQPGYYKFIGVEDDVFKRRSMIPVLRKLINRSTWKTELCSKTKVEVVDDRYGRHN